MPKLRMIQTHEIAAIRNRGLSTPMCGLSFEDHEWVRAQSGETVLVVLCNTCGRYPVELLAQLTVIETPRAH